MRPWQHGCRSGMPELLRCDHHRHNKAARKGGLKWPGDPHIQRLPHRRELAPCEQGGGLEAPTSFDHHTCAWRDLPAPTFHCLMAASL